MADIFSSSKIGSAFDAVSGFVDNTLSIFDKNNQALADAELSKMNIDLDTWYKKQIQGFENRTDYENFEHDFQTAYDEKMSEYTQRSGKSRYDNLYTQKKGEEMFNSLRQNASVSVGGMVENGKINRAVADRSQNIENLNQTMAGGQDRLDRQCAELDAIKGMNRLTQDQYNTEKQKLLDGNAYDMYTAEEARVISQNPKWTEAQLDKWMSTYTPDISAPGSINAGMAADGSLSRKFSSAQYSVSNDIKEKAGKYMQSLVKQQQEETNKNIEDRNRQILNDIYAGRSTYTRDDLLKRIDSIEHGYGELQLENGDRKAREWELRQAAEKMDKKGGSGGSGLSGFETQINKEVDGRVQASRLGLNSGEAGLSSLYGARDQFMEDSFYPLCAAYGLSSEDIALERAKVSNSFVDKASKVYEGDDKMQSYFKEVNTYVQGLCKDNGKDSKPIIDEAMQYMHDLLFDVSPSNIDYESIKSDVQGHIQLWVTDELVMQELDKKGSNTFAADNGKAGGKKSTGYFGGIDTGDSLEVLALGASEMSTSKIAYTNSLGQVVQAPNTKESVKKFDSAAADVISGIDNIPRENIEASWQEDRDRHDITGGRIYRAKGPDGRQHSYVIASTGQKTFNVYKDGELLSSSDDIKNSRKKSIQTDKSGNKAARKALKENSKAEEAKADDIRTVISTFDIAEGFNRQASSGGISKDEEAQANDPEMMKYRDALKKFDEQIKSSKKEGYSPIKSISYYEWSKLTDKEKLIALENEYAKKIVK